MPKLVILFFLCVGAVIVIAALVWGVKHLFFSTFRDAKKEGLIEGNESVDDRIPGEYYVRYGKKRVNRCKSRNSPKNDSANS